MADAPLAGRVALVTGAGRGIGLGISQALSAAGAAVAITYRKDVKSAEAAVAALPSYGKAYCSDVADVDGAQRLIAQVVEDFGQLDILVHNAGIASRGHDVAGTSVEEVRRLLEVHAVGPHQLSRAALPHLRRNARSDIVFISSIATRHHMAGGAPYSMGKAAVEALAHTLAMEERDRGVHVNIVAPGLVDTDMGQRMMRATRGMEDIRDADAESPFGRVCAPSDVAAVVCFLVGSGAQYLTDQRIVVDGGTF
ncbi:NAD(P)-dependent dehydrogenase (short-subunit alcohol dehydrogenase family) [Jatrophihabitans sp. GAS493]|uniref:SDR family NAD(P)-dependent oxidoreductase n=1 Tax=Jatrophihabitans sp. GAS493 TaxID=1907575 RepID=UPI000BBF7FE9|nr:SDR family oxidoreductase [Jatrophihabitans sp. GAS493]SOD74613.1 NAD(P)-dependent dehydrogenase (short-subunit alcohol dehydrogenase family) [Jatrophihabitans sp. GAS493]